MTVIKKFVSILLAASLCIGSIYSVQGDNAFMVDAEFSSVDVYYDDILDALSLHQDWQYYQNCLNLIEYAQSSSTALLVYTQSASDLQSFNVTVWDLWSPETWNYDIQWKLSSTGTMSYSTSASNPSWQRIRYAYFCIDTNFTLYYGWSYLDYEVSNARNFDLTNRIAVDSVSINSIDYIQSVSKDFYDKNKNLLFSANILEGDPLPPEPASFELVRFQLGSRTYLTISDQALIRAINPDTEGLEFYLGYMFEEQEHIDHINYSDLQVIQGAEYMIAVELENISPIGVYCYDITNLEYDSIFYAKILGLWYDEWVPFYEAVNLPLNAPSGPGDVVQPYDQAWEQIINYYNTYNTTHVVPRDLGDRLFGLTGSQTAACWVSLPYDLIPSGTTDPTLETIQWGFNDLDPAIDFSLMDVLVFPAGAAEALVEYYYNVNFDPSMVQVDRFAFGNLLNMYDVIIVVNPEWDGVSLNPFVVSESGGFLHRGFTGLSQGGMDFVDRATSPWFENQTYHGFCFITKKAIQKQQLFNFNDGITKTYDLMVQYIDKRDSWDDSFLLWSSSVFDMLNSLDGRLSKIEWFLTGDIKLSDYLNNILDKLDNLVNNTSVDEVEPDSWYASLWRFVKRFDIQDSTFANWLDDLDIFYDDLPDLPEVQPTIIPFPTYIPAPTEAAG